MVAKPSYTRYYKLSDGSFFEDWSVDAAKIANDDWSGVPYLVGYLGDVSASTTANIVPANSTTITDLGAVDAVILGSNVASTSGGVGVFQTLADQVVALQGSGTADSPSLVLYLDATGRSDLRLEFDLRDIDSTADNTAQSFAVQFRFGDSGTWTNVAGSYVADASVGPSLTNSVHYAYDLPASLNGQGEIQLRFATSNAASNDEWIGIDNIRVTSNAGGASDSVPPTLTGSTPSDDGTGVSADANIVLTFSEPVRASTGSVTITDNAGDTRVIALSDTSQVTFSGAQVTINPVADLRQGATYHVTIGADALVDAAGNAYAGNAANPIDFTTVNPLVVTRIGTIQGETHLSAYRGTEVLTQGVVTAIDTTGARGFWLQDPTGDGNVNTSDAIFVFTSALAGLAVGQSVQVSGIVTEFFGSTAGALSVTEITAPTVTALSTSLGTVQATLIGQGGRAIPTSVIDNDRFATYDPAQDGIDFYESLEGMVVTVHQAQAVAPTTTTTAGTSTWVVADRGVGATGMNARGGITIDGSDIVTADFNPERIQIFADTGVNTGFTGKYAMGDLVGDVTGVVSYFGGNYQLVPTTASTTTGSTALPRETTALRGDATHLTFAEYNVENLDPGDAKFDVLGRDIAVNLGSPDIIALEEIQDADGAGSGSDLSGATTLNKLIAAIADAGGPRYGYVEVAPTVTNTSGGENNANIRNAFLYNLDRVRYVDGTARLVTDTDPANGDAFRNSRKPLVADFTFNGETITTVAVHNYARSGSDPLFGTTQPPVNSGDQVRLDQTTALHDYIVQLQQANPNAKIAVAGDFNGFQFENSLRILEAGGSLTNLDPLLRAEERYTYLFEGNAQQIDHILASANLAGTAAFDIVHLNTGQPGEVTSDHDPTLAQFTIEAAVTLSGTSDVSYATSTRAVTVNGSSSSDSVTGTRFADSLYGNDGFDRLRGGEGNDTIAGGAGFDRMQGGAGNDTFLFRKGDLVDPRGNGGQMDHIIDFHGAGTTGTGEQDYLSFTGFGAGARLDFAYTLGSDALQVYRVVTDAGYQGSVLVQMADGTARLAAGDYGFF